jgi:uncharacterized membrane-anchored protein
MLSGDAMTHHAQSEIDTLEERQWLIADRLAELAQAPATGVKREIDRLRKELLAAEVRLRAAHNENREGER